MSSHPLMYMPYANAKVMETPTGSRLISYRTTACEIENGWLHCYGLFSMTTRRHIGAYIKEKAPRLTYYDAKKCYLDNLEVNIFTREFRSIENKKEENTMKNTEIESITLTEEEERFCAECGCVIEGEGHEIDGNRYCDDCFEEYFVECADCGELIRIDDASYFAACADELRDGHFGKFTWNKRTKFHQAILARLA